MNKWYVIKTKPNQEKRAVLNLQNQKFKVFFPEILRERRVRGKLVTLNEPFFPSYIFVNFDIERDHWTKINNSYGVSKLLSIGGTPQQIKDNFINSLMSFIKNDKYIENLFSFKINQNVKIKDGPFEGFFASVIKKVGKDRVKLFINFLTRQTSIILDKKSLLPA